MRYIIAFILLVSVPAFARDDGRYAQSPLKAWFDSLKSKKGLCCAEADGRETEYDIRKDKYWVPVNGMWTQVPDEALLTGPNKVGRAMLWLDPLDRYAASSPAAAREDIVVPAQAGTQ